MRLSKPRIEPLTDDQFTDKHRELLGAQIEQGSVYNIFRTLAHAPKAFERFMAWGGYVLSRRNDLPAREREIVILRTGFNWKSGYEWAQHVRIGLRSGLTEEEIERIKQGPDADGWSPLESALLRATDELTSDAFVTDETWEALNELSDKQRMDVVFTVGQYSQVSMMLNSFGVQLDDDLTGDPDLTP